MANLKTPGNVKLWFAVVDMEGNPDMAQVEHPEDCYDEDAYVSLADFEAQAARMEEQARWEIGFRNIVTRTIGPSAPFEIDQMVNLIEAAWKQRDALKARCEALEDACRRQVENIERWQETGESAGPEESNSIYEQLRAALRAAGE